MAPAGPHKGVRTEATREKYSPLLREANTVKDFATAQQWYKMESVPVYIHELMIYSFREQIQSNNHEVNKCKKETQHE